MTKKDWIIEIAGIIALALLGGVFGLIWFISEGII